MMSRLLGCGFSPKTGSAASLTMGSIVRGSLQRRISECPSAKESPPVIARKIPAPSRQIGCVGPASHIDEKVPRVDRVFALVPEQGRHRRAGIDQVPEAQVETPRR